MKLVTVSRLRRVSRGALIGLLAGALFAGGASAARWLASRPARPGAPGPIALAAALGTLGGVEAHRKPNRLIREKSPYLLQHAYNPVDWYPWGEEAFEKARREEKPIFLSIGYSTCHWCHVMERESFENYSVAELLNRWFVPIKVDREERPDVDRIYMTAMQAMGMGGGWPLNVFLTPDLRPFFGGTYFPPDSRLGRPGLPDVLARVHEAWLAQRPQIEASGRQVLEALAAPVETDSGPGSRAALIEHGYETLERIYDPEHGGFGTAPKFPSISNLDFLMRYATLEPERHAHAREMALRQLDAMRAGGIHDHLGGGFHRYSTDREWLVPHFEKMLYDQAEIAWANLEAYQVTGEPEYAAVARDVFAYVSRHMTSPEGAFYSAEDADSEGEEGKFYVWTPAELEAVLGKEDAAVFGYRYGVTPRGNFEGGRSILHEAHAPGETALHFKLLPEEARERIERARQRLFEARARRVRPHRDDKVLASWNGLMISALARGGRVLDDAALARAAARAGEFVWANLYDPKTGTLDRRWREGETAGPGQLDDYADLALGMIDLYRATFDPLWLERAVGVTEAMIARFWDDRDGGFFESPAGDPHMSLRLKDDFDGAELAGNSIAARNLITLAALLDRDDWRRKASHLLDHYARRLRNNPVAMPEMLVAMDLERAAPRQVVIAGKPGAADTRALLSELNRRFLPHVEVLLVDGGALQERLAKLAPFTRGLTLHDGKATAYVCENYACKLPTHDRAVFAAQLEERPQHPTHGERR